MRSYVYFLLIIFISACDKESSSDNGYQKIFFANLKPEKQAKILQKFIIKSKQDGEYIIQGKIFTPNKKELLNHPVMPNGSMPNIDDI